MNNRDFNFDLLRALATVSVVALHASGPVLYSYGAIAPGEWWTANVVDSAVRFSVPVFLMLTGALLLPRVEATGSFLKKRFSRLIGPFIFWSLIYLAVALYFQPRGSDSWTFFQQRLQSGISYHLWYVYMLAGIYLILPVLQRWIALAERRDLEYFLLLWLIALFASTQFVADHLPDFNLVYFSGYIGYPVLGYYLNTFFRKDKSAAGKGPETNLPAGFSYLYRNSTRIALVALTIGFVVTAVATGWISKKTNRFDQTFYEYLSFNVIAMATGIFILGINSSTEKTGKRTRAVIQILSRYSFGIYLSHVFVLKLATLLKWDLLVLKFISFLQWEWLTAVVKGSGAIQSGTSAMALHPAIGIPLLTVATTLAALGITLVLNRLPGGKYISG